MTTRRPPRWLPLALLGPAVLHGWAGASTAAAAGHEGECTDEAGVTVVVSHNELGGGTVVRCAPDFPEGGTGLDALQLAGFIPEGTLKEGPSFVCRINDRPSADEVIAVRDSQYRESCTTTPPDWAFWSYWHAEPGGEWTYAGVGVTRKVEPGSTEGWSFSLDKSTNEAPQPGQGPALPAPDAGASTPAGTSTVASIAGVAALGLAGTLVWWRRRREA